MVKDRKVSGLVPELLKHELTQGLGQIISDKSIFLYKFLKSPRIIGSVTPSSPFLAQAMIKLINWDNIRSIVELGAGTGVFTRYIYQLKHPDCQGIIFEQDQEMCQRLMHMYQGLHFCFRAENIYGAIQELGFSQVDCVLSSLPFAAFPQTLRERVLDGVMRSLKPGGLFIAFQYSLQMKYELLKRFTKTDIEFVLLNIPPAFVYYCHK